MGAESKLTLKTLSTMFRVLFDMVRWFWFDGFVVSYYDTERYFVVFYYDAESYFVVFNQ